MKFEDLNVGDKFTAVTGEYPHKLIWQKIEYKKIEEGPIMFGANCFRVEEPEDCDYGFIYQNFSYSNVKLVEAVESKDQIKIDLYGD